MRKLVFIFVCALSVLSMQAVDIALVSNAFKNGDATMLANNMNSEVDIAVIFVHKSYKKLTKN